MGEPVCPFCHLDRSRIRLECAFAVAFHDGFPTIRGRFSDDGQWLTQVNMERGGGRGWKHSAVFISTVNWGLACTIPMTKDGIGALG